MTATAGLTGPSTKQISASSSNGYDPEDGDPDQMRARDGKARNHWPTTPQKPVSRSHNHFTCQHLPPTPAQTPTRGTKRANLSDSGPNPDTPCSKRLLSHAQRTPCRSLFRTDSIPKFSILYDEKTVKGTKISALELKRASESILSQVDWDEVEEHVASNRRGSTFRKAIKKILQERVDELFENESSLESAR